MLTPISLQVPIKAARACTPSDHLPLSPQASIRATAWRAFLDISVRRMKHYYRDLVEQV